jgi:bifunctional DNA-binding transcriptional regulator/antitoxin component of YhaV-PrlF toxin-antitoxin module
VTGNAKVIRLINAACREYRLGSALLRESGLIPGHQGRCGWKTGKTMKKYKFTAKIEAGDGGGAYVLFPYDTEKEFATRGKVPVKAAFNGVPYRGSLIKYGKPLHVLGVPKAIREQTGKGPGDRIEVVVWKDDEVRTVEVPAQFEILMKKEGLLPVFKSLSYTHRKEYCRWITEAKMQETRLKRLEKAIEMLRKGVSTPG